jgi:hypothetical protein
MPWNTDKTITRMNLENMQVKEANFRKPHIVGFHLREMSRIGKSRQKED